MSKTKVNRRVPTAAPEKKSMDSQVVADPTGRAIRETIESIAVAVILAFLFRGFVAEAFVIPTGSMAPTLQGRHMDVTCAKCGCPYRTGASGENEGRSEVVQTTCPICRYPMDLDKDRDPNQASFNGDRILVSKFTYEVSEPKRWDVIVFKFPGNAKQNYIKRLIGLPNETVWVRHGDIYVGSNVDDKDSAGDSRIVRKPPDKVKAMLQMVDDTRYRSADLSAAGWPERWQARSAAGSPTWQPQAEGHGFETAATTGSEAWLRYRHVVPWSEDWEDLRGRCQQRLADGTLQGQLITDYYAYNDGAEVAGPEGSPWLRGGRLGRYRSGEFKAAGKHWVGDLAVECEDVEVQGSQGAVLLDLVEGGVHYTCRIDVAGGRAVLSIDGGQRSFVGEDGVKALHPQGVTKLRGPGSYDLRFSKCDDQLLLWVNDRLVEFDGPTTYTPDRNVKPKWRPEDPADLEPVGLGADGVALRVGRLRVLRDVYYVATSYQTFPAEDDYDDLLTPGDRDEYLARVFADPKSWEKTPLFDARRENVRFQTGPDEFFPCGDNSPQSRDARVWSQFGDLQQPHPPPFVRRELLTGKALMIYWPHSWRRPIPMLPNFRRMGLIR
jgi:signal peptidase I